MDKKPVELTKKQELNNHITASRKFVRQAKVHVIRKLVREIQLLRDRKGSEETQLKSKRKADRLYSEIPIIKALNVDKVTVHSLLNKSKLQDVLQNVNASIEERALARLSHHPSLNARVTKYREANVNWSLQIPVLLEKSRTKAKLAEKKLATKQLSKETVKKQKNPSLDDKKAVGSEEEEEEALSSDDNNDDDDELSGEEVVNSDSDEQSVNSEGEESDHSDSVESEVELPKTKNLKKNRKINKSKIIEEETKKEEKSVKLDLNKTQGTIKVQVIKDWSEFEIETAEGKVETVSTKLARPKPKSSFFLGGEDDPSKDKPEDAADHQEQKIGNRRGRRAAEFQGNKGGFQNRDNHNNGNWEKFSNRSERRQPRVRYFESNSSSSHGGDTLLKPKYLESKPSLVDRQFGNSSSSKRKFPTVEKRDTFSGVSEGKRGQVESSVNTKKEHLHPSWEAKKRLNLSLNVFKGKKIKFDD